MPQQMTRIVIPGGLSFADLQLTRDADGQVSYKGSAIMRICQASGLPAALLQDECYENVATLIAAWYQVHRHHGGAPDPVAEDLIAEIQTGNAKGQPFNHPPGHA